MTTDNNDIYVCVDIETDGPVPGKNNMLSLAAAAYRLNKNPDGTLYKTLVSSFTVNLRDVPGCVPDDLTIREFWGKNLEAWAVAMRNRVEPRVGLQDFVNWCDCLHGQLNGEIIFAAYPLAFDYMWVTHYLRMYDIDSPFGFRSLDIKSLAMGFRVATGTGSGFTGWSRDDLPCAFFDDLPHTHIALDDAIEQGALLCNIILALDTLSATKSKTYDYTVNIGEL